MAGATVAHLTAIIDADTSGFDAGVDSANQKLSELGQSAGQSGKNIADGLNVAGKMAAGLGAALAAPFIGAIKQASDFEFAMDAVNAALGGVDTAQLEALEEQALELGASSKFSAEEVAGVQEELAKSGLNAQQLLDGATKSVLDLAAATGEDLQTSTISAAAALNMFSLDGSEASRVADILTTALNNSSATLPDLQSGLNHLGPVMSNLNQYADDQEQAFIDAAAAIAFFNQRGLKAANAGNSLARGLQNLSSPTSKATKRLEELGIAAFDLEGNFIGFPELFDQLNTAMGDLSDAEREAALGMIFGAQAADVMNQAIKEGGDPLRELIKLFDEEGVAARQAELRQDNLTSAVEQLGGALNGLAVQMGKPLLDPLRRATEGVTEMVDRLAEAPEPVQRLVSQFGLLSGGLLTFGGGAAWGTSKVLEMGAAFTKAGLSLPKFAAGLALATLAIGAGLLAYEHNFLGFADLVDEKMADAGAAIETFGETFGEVFNAQKARGMNDIANAVDSFGKALFDATGIDLIEQTSRLARGIDALGRSFEENAEKGVDRWVNALESSGDAARTMGNEDLANELDRLSLAWGAMADNMRETEGQMPQLNRELSALQHGAEALTGWDVTGFFDSLGLAAANAQDDLTDLKNALGAGDWSEVGQILMRDAPNIETFFNNLGDSLTALQEGIATFDLGDAMQGVSDQVTGWFNDLGDLLLGRGFDSLGGPGEREATTGLVAQLADNLGLSLETLPSLLTDKLAAIGNPFAGLGQWLQDGLNEVGRFFLPQEMPAGLGGAGFGDTSGISQWFGGIVEGIGVGMDQAVHDLGALVEEKKTGFKNALGDFFGPIGQFLFPSEDALAAEDASLGNPAELGAQFGESLINTFTDPEFEAGLNAAIADLPDEAFSATGAALLGAISEGMKTAMTEGVPSGTTGQLPAAPLGQQMVSDLATGLTDAITAAPQELFAPMANALGTQLGTAFETALVGAPLTSQEIAAGVQPAAGAGLQLVQGLATGLTDSITAAPQETFTPVANALGQQLATALATMPTTATPAPGPGGTPVQVPGLGQTMVQGLATGLTESIAAADAALFVPVSNALGGKLGEAMSLAAQPVQPPGGTGPVAPDSGVGLSMVQGLATGLTDSITAAPVETFHPVANALGQQLTTALEAAMTQTLGVGGGGPVSEDAAFGIGQQMVNKLATGLEASIANAPQETFTPVGAALGTKLSEALTTAVGDTGTGGETDVGNQLGVAVGDAIASGVQEANWDTVGQTLGTKLGETLTTVASGQGAVDVSQQVGDAVGQMLRTGIEQADFAGVGDAVSTQLGEQLDTAIQEVSSSVEESMSQMTEAVSQAASQMGEGIAQATEQASAAVEQMSAAVEEATASVTAAVDQMSAAVEQAGATMEEAASQAAQAAEEVGTAASEAAAAVEQAMQQMAAAVQAAAGAIEGAAGQIVAALNSIVGAAQAAGAAIGAALSSGFTGELGIASPSKVFVGHGKNIVAGLALGMGSGQGVVDTSSKALARHALRSLAQAIGMGSPAKRFVPHGRAITDGMLRGMLEQARGRLQQAMGQMAGAVGSAMGKVQSAMASAMERVRGEARGAGQGAGEAAARGVGDGMAAGERHVERAARRLWRKALRELLRGTGAARFLGEEWAREFWEGMLDPSGSLAFAQFVTAQMVAAAENAVQAALARVKGLITQLEIVASAISTLESEIASLESQLASIDSQIASAQRAAADRAAAAAGQARIDAAQEELALQRQITQELEARFQQEFSAAHQAHIRAVQTRSAAAQASYEAKVRQAEATHAAIAESKIKEDQLEAVLEAVRAAVAAEAEARREAAEAAAMAELQARKAAIAAELEAKKAALAEEQRLQEELERQKHEALVEYTQAVIKESQKRIAQLQRERKHADSPQERAEIKAQIALERQRIALANELAAALERQASAQTPEELAEANAQVDFLTAQIEALGEVDVGALLQEIAGTLSEAATEMSTAADSMSKAAGSLGSMDVTGSMQSAEKAVAGVGGAAGETGEKMFDMAAKYQEVTDKMTADTLAFQEQFRGMVEATRGTAAQGGAEIGNALAEGITGRIDAGAPALQQTMLDGLQQGIDDADQAAGTGGDEIATTFGAAMREQLGVQLPKVHQDILGGMEQATNETARAAGKGGKAVGADYTGGVKQKVDAGTPKFQTAMHKGVDQGVRQTTRLASQGGKSIGNALSDGIRDGVRDRAKGIADEAARTVRDAVRAANQAARAHSPSRAMMEVGDNMGLGLIYGLRGRRGEAREASAALVHIPALSPTSAGGVTGRRAFEERGRPLNLTIEHLELPQVTNPEEFLAVMETMARTNGVSSGRQ